MCDASGKLSGTNHGERVEAPHPSPPPAYRRRGKKRGAHAFTLIEMLLVMVIIVILASIAVPSYLKYEATAQKNAATAQIASFKQALQAFALFNNGAYPTTAQGLQSLVADPGGVTGWTKTLDTQAVPNDPWGTAYKYQCPSETEGKDYDIISAGPDKQFGTQDDISN